jgi:hypothetical protein
MTLMQHVVADQGGSRAASLIVNGVKASKEKVVSQSRL